MTDSHLENFSEIQSTLRCSGWLSQHGMPQMWALVTPGAPLTPRTFYVRGTGHPVKPGLVHRGSFALYDGAFIGHLFEHGLARL